MHMLAERVSKVEGKDNIFFLNTTPRVIDNVDGEVKDKTEYVNIFKSEENRESI